jgi:NAD(P)-dependent dehydrogenase (short-subunit alcohol dehydrogenase family)
MDLELTDKTALVLGGADGLGAAIARALYVEGASVLVADRNAERAASFARELGDRAAATHCDVANKADIAAAITACSSQFAKLHILVHAVGLTLPDPIDRIDDTDIETTFDINMRSVVWAVQAAAAPMRQAGYGRVVLLGSGSGMKGSASLSLYTASKFFLRGLMQAAALELGPAGITANMVCPTDVYPEGDRPAGSWNNDKLVRISCEKEGVSDLAGVREKRSARTPVRRSCTADDVANVVVFLASPRAGFINAQTIGLNGGLLPT